jgi:hypothetical protein
VGDVVAADALIDGLWEDRLPANPRASLQSVVSRLRSRLDSADSSALITRPLPTDTILHIGPEAIIKITGLRNPCVQLDHYQKGLTAAVLDRDERGNLIRKAGIMAIVLKSGLVRKGDTITVHLPPEPHRPLERV